MDQSESQPITDVVNALLCRQTSYSEARSQKRLLLAECRARWDEGAPVLPAELLARWPSDPHTDPDTAGLLFEDWLQCHLHGQEKSVDDYSREFPEQKEALNHLVSREALLRSLGRVSNTSTPLLGLPRVGDTLFGFRLLQELGHGAFARVYLAQQGDLAARPVVVKVSAIEGTEPQTLAQLQHTHIVPIYSLHEDTRAGLRAVCMPYFGGASLSRVLSHLWASGTPPTRGEQLVKSLQQVQGPTVQKREGNSLVGQASSLAGASEDACPTNGWESEDAEPTVLHHQQPDSGQERTALNILAGGSYVRAAVWLTARLAEGLHHAHQRGVLHRDIKPGNILLAADGQPLLLDFNLAQVQDCDPAQATLGGTVAYMAPEHLQALLGRGPERARAVDHRSDIYSLGMVLFETLAGARPFEQSASYSAPNLMIQAMAVERGRAAPSIRGQRGDVPWGLESILRKCLAPEPADRYQQANHLADDLQCWLDDRSLHYAPELSRAERWHKWRRRHPRFMAAAPVALAGALLLLIIGLVLANVNTHLRSTQQELSTAKEREQKQAFDAGTVRALFLVNTVVPGLEHLRGEGIRACEETLALYGVLEGDAWVGPPPGPALQPAERLSLAENARELLLLLAYGRVKLAPQDPAVLHEALGLLDRAGAIPGLPASRALWHDRARYLALLGQADEAAAARQKAEQVPATSAHDHYLLATSHAHKGTAEGFQRALVDLGNALELEPRHYWSWFQRGLCHLELKEPLRAADDFRICIGLRPQEAWGHFNCGCAYDRGGNTLTAVRYYSEALKYQPDLVQAYTNRGMALLELKRYGEALADFDRARQLGRETAALQGGRGMALEGLGRHDEADAAFGQSLAGPVPLTLPDRTSLLWTYGFAVAGRRPEAAVKAFDAVLGQDAAHPQALYGRAMLAANQGQLAEAIRFFDRALSAQPGFTAARRYRAVLLARRGEHQRADEDVVQSLKEDSAGPLTLYAAACVFALQSEHRRDGRLAEKALLLLQQAAGRGADVSKAKDDPDLACLRLRPEFVELLQGR